MNVVPTFRSMLSPAAHRPLARTVRFGILSTFPPTACGLASFSSALAASLSSRGSEVSVVRIADGSSSSDGRVVAELVNGSSLSSAACVESLNEHEAVIIQHDYDLYGGTHGDELLTILGGLRVPSIVVVHNVMKDPAPHQRWVLEQVTTMAGRVVVMSEVACERLCREYAVDRRKIVTIPHGASLPTQPRGKRTSRPIILTCGLLGPGKGVERVIDVMPALASVAGRPRYLVAGQTHPRVAVREGEAYREARIQQAHHLGVADSVSFDDRYLDRASLTALIQSAAVIVLPYDSTDQVTSGVLVDAVASGRPVVATPFPHAVEMLRDGAGIIVPHDDPEALTGALRRVLTQPRLAGAMAAEARQLAPAMAWPVVAQSYVQLAAQMLLERRTSE
ncbi:glycosyl transferase family 1 [Mycolicibacterium iranicum]|uniref:Glycosyl transferase family 1 n=2 Tax=Mycolicibacterium iranicum TaxID=912594 RepID=A0A1X1WS86_MYCIR|nr:glycosyl transferase family 1 [Mycolicibacterium iranicum]